MPSQGKASTTPGPPWNELGYNEHPAVTRNFVSWEESPVVGNQTDF